MTSEQQGSVVRGSVVRLGSFGFGVDTAAFSTLRRRTEAAWAEVERIGGVPVAQFMGWSETITLQGTVYPFWRGGLGQLPALRALVRAGKPLLMADGLGTVHGYWYVKSLEEDGSLHTPTGQPQKQGFTLDLGFHGLRLED